MNGELIPKQIAKVLRRGGAEVVKVGRGNSLCLGDSDMAVYPKPPDQSLLFLIVFNGKTYCYYSFCLLSHAINKHVFVWDH